MTIPKSRLRLHLAGTAHRLIPLPVMPAVVAAQVSRAKRNPRRMADARQEMSVLLDHSGLGLDLDETAVKYLGWEIWRRESRWHAGMFPPLRVEGLDDFLATHERFGGVLLTLMHLGPYESAGISLVQAGAPRAEALMDNRYFDERPPPSDRSFRRIIESGAAVHPASIGVRGIIDLLRAGKIVSMATDLPGSVALRFAGRDVRGASGVAVAALATNAPIVPRTMECDDRGWFVRLHPALDPSSFRDAQALLQELTSLQEPSVLAQPEAWVKPTDRYELVD